MQKSKLSGNRIFAILCMIYGCLLHFGESSMNNMTYDVVLIGGAIILIYLIFLLDKQKGNL